MSEQKAISINEDIDKHIEQSKKTGNHFLVVLEFSENGICEYKIIDDTTISTTDIYTNIPRFSGGC